MDVHRDSADPEPSDTTRSLIYRGLSRAQMVVHVVNEQVDDGFLTFTNNTKLEENVQFDQDEELKKREAVQREGAMTQLGEALKKHPKRITELVEAVRRARELLSSSPDATMLTMVEQGEAELQQIIAKAFADPDRMQYLSVNVLQEALLAVDTVPTGIIEESKLDEARARLKQVRSGGVGSTKI